jgi:hypothetical protein
MGGSVTTDEVDIGLGNNLSSRHDANGPIRGSYYVLGVIPVSPEYNPPDFCEDCGAPFRWLSRQGGIYLLQDMLDREDIDPARLEAHEQLEALTNPDLDEDEQRRRCERFKRSDRSSPAGFRGSRFGRSLTQA